MVVAERSYRTDGKLCGSHSGRLHHRHYRPNRAFATWQGLKSREAAKMLWDGRCRQTALGSFARTTRFEE